jgi:hypothetical protein
MKPLPRVRPGLLRHQLEEQVLVYESRGDRVHLLDPTTACVLTLLQEGGWTREGIAAELVARLGVESGESFLPLAIEELRAADLLDQDPEVSEPQLDIGRREMMRKVAMASAAALLVPAIVTFTASPAYAGGSATGSVGLCGTCVTAADCAGGRACNNDHACCNSCNSKRPTGVGCSSGANCCSGTCGANSLCT